MKNFPISQDIVTAINKARTFRELAENAAIPYLKYIVENSGPNMKIWQVCGPFTTGKRSQEVNTEAFNKAMSQMKSLGHVIFDQFPFEEKILGFIKEWRGGGGEGYCELVLTEFYTPIFESGMLTDFLFIPGYEASHGANWEHTVAPKYNIKRSYIPEEWFEVFDIDILDQSII